MQILYRPVGIEPLLDYVNSCSNSFVLTTFDIKNSTNLTLLRQYTPHINILSPTESISTFLYYCFDNK